MKISKAKAEAWLTEETENEADIEMVEVYDLGEAERENRANSLR